MVVPATDEPASLERCLAALRASTAPPEQIVVVTEPPGTGPAAARNAGASAAEHELIAFVDADVAVHPDALARLRQLFAADPDLVAAFGSYDDTPAAPGTVSRFRNLLHHHVHTSSPGPAETFWAGLGAVRRASLIEHGGFDEQRFAVPAVEDIELGMRLRASGAAIVLDPGVRGTHLKRWTLASMVRTDFARRGVPWLRLQLESASPSVALNLSTRQRAAALTSVVLVGAAARRRPCMALAALGAALALNAPFYCLLARRGGIRLLLAGVALHIVHNLVAVAAVPVALTQHLLESGVRQGSRRFAATRCGGTGSGELFVREPGGGR